MGKARMRAGLIIGGLLASAGIIAAAQPPTVSQMLSFRPKQAGINYSSPTAQEKENCKVELVNGTRGSSAWLLRDPQGRILRRFFDSNGDKKIDIWSYYLDGVEVYREIDSTFTGVVDQYRWLNSGGMKWGLDTNKDGKIDTWKIISAEEVSQEILQALITKDFERLQALWITDAEVKGLELTGAEADRIRDLRGQAQTKFLTAIAKLNLTPQTHWERLEAPSPQCIPGDQIGLKRDLIKNHRCTILYENNGKHDWLQTGEMIQTGLAWRLVDAPTPGPAVEGNNSTDPTSTDPVILAILDDLKKLDADAPKGDIPDNSALYQYNMKRADLLKKALPKITKNEEKDQWIRQIADCLNAAAQAGPDKDQKAYECLVDLEKQVAGSQKGSLLAAYVTFREMSADFAAKNNQGGGDFMKNQEAWLNRLAKFVQDYPQGEDTPDALLQAGMVSEILGKEDQAKKWYQQLATNFADKKSMADKATGALKRLDLEGKPFELSGPTLDGKTFDIKSLANKVVIVYYWASWNKQSVGDFARLKLLLSTYGIKGVELVCINLDNSPPEANSAPSNAGVPGVQLFQPGSLDGPLATQYGIMVLPNMFLVGKDGKVVSRTVQLANLEDEIKKLVGK
jgi:hypothetical protein